MRLFRVVSNSYEAKSLTLTTNIEFSRWGIALAGETLAAAMVGRIVHHIGAPWSFEARAGGWRSRCCWETQGGASLVFR